MDVHYKERVHEHIVSDLYSQSPSPTSLPSTTGFRLINARVRAGFKETATENPACGGPVTAAEANPLGGVITKECAQPLPARYVSVDIPGRAILTLCEVKVEEGPCDRKASS